MPEHRFFAAIYDRALEGVERGGMREMRAALLAEASGQTVELGAGTGHNLAHYTAAVSELILTEPDPFMARRLRERLAAEPPRSDSSMVLEAGAERLPVEDGSVDTVVSTLVMCTVPDPELVLTEVARVLRPGGRVLFLEHVRDADGSRRARWQDRLERPWGLFAGGCHPNRDTEATLRGSSLQVERLERERMPTVGSALVRPLIVGAARLAVQG